RRSSLSYLPSILPPARHPFPTRRSSDLDRDRSAGILQREARRTELIVGWQADVNRVPAGFGVQERRRAEGRAQHKSLLGSALQTDRKSTRLNSSHQIISYAVVCLEKRNA